LKTATRSHGHRALPSSLAGAGSYVPRSCALSARCLNGQRRIHPPECLSSLPEQRPGLELPTCAPRAAPKDTPGRVWSIGPGSRPCQGESLACQCGRPPESRACQGGRWMPDAAGGGRSVQSSGCVARRGRVRCRGQCNGQQSVRAHGHLSCEPCSQVQVLDVSREFKQAGDCWVAPQT
jgi:hypothetical protein